MSSKRTFNARPTVPQESSDAGLEEMANCEDAEAVRLTAHAEKKRRGISQGKGGKRAQEKTKDAARKAAEEEKVSEDDEPLATAIIDDAISGERVDGLAYPSCMRCIHSNATCQWKKSAIHVRLLNPTQRSRRCENCARSKTACQFIWEQGPIRPVESDLGPESAAKRAAADFDTSLEAIDKNIASLVKFTTSLDAKTEEQGEVDMGLFDLIHTSLDDLHETYNNDN